MRTLKCLMLVPSRSPPTAEYGSLSSSSTDCSLGKRRLRTAMSRLSPSLPEEHNLSVYVRQVQDDQLHLQCNFVIGTSLAWTFCTISTIPIRADIVVLANSRGTMLIRESYPCLSVQALTQLSWQRIAFMLMFSTTQGALAWLWDGNARGARSRLKTDCAGSESSVIISYPLGTRGETQGEGVRHRDCRTVVGMTAVGGA
ncbi:hypothetical protein B0H21DRAFT_427082 [Amylocystis lapponica]|nr:hypothetical protein B0H21DRAFT_427082 [Amylocystis lapponica]